MTPAAERSVVFLQKMMRAKHARRGYVACPTPRRAFRAYHATTFASVTPHGLAAPAFTSRTRIQIPFILHIC